MLNMPYKTLKQKGKVFDTREDEKDRRFYNKNVAIWFTHVLNKSFTVNLGFDSSNSTCVVL